MANILYFDGTDYVEVPEEEAEKAEASGLKRQVLMLSPEGESVAVPVEESTAALKQGLKLPGVEEPKLSTPKPTSTAEAAALAAFSGYVPGGQFLIEKTAGAFGVPEDVTKQYTQQVREEHPVLTTGIEIGSALTSPVSIGGTILKAGTRITSKLAALLTAAEKSGAVGKVATSAAKGTFIGATNSAVEGAARAEPGKRLEGALEAAKTGAYIGAPLGVLGKFIGDAAGPATAAAAEKEIGVTPTKLSKVKSRYGQDIANSVGEIAKKEKLLPGLSPKAAEQKTRELVQETGKKMGEIMENLHKNGEKINVQDSLNDVEHILLSPFGDPKRIADRELLNEYNKLNNEILPSFYEQATTGGWQDMANMRRYLTERLAVTSDPAIYKKAIIALDDVIKHRMDQVVPGLGDSYQQLKTKYGALSTIQEALSKKAGPNVLGTLKRGEPIKAATKALVGIPLQKVQDLGIYYGEKGARTLEQLLEKTPRIREMEKDRSK